MSSPLHLVILFLLAGCHIQASAPRLVTSDLPPVYCPDNGDGTYKNPIIFADYSDPDVIRVGDDFYMTASSFSCFPGLPILHSRDLVNWQIVGHALQRYPAPFDRNFNTPNHGNGVWAPSIRFHKNLFWIFFGDPDLGIFMTTARNPAGPWAPLTRVKEAKGWIDCCPLWDDDGKASLVHAFARSRSGLNNRLDICRMSEDGLRLLDEGTTVYNGGTDPSGAATRRAGGYTTVEGPKLYKRNGYYYIFAPGGGVANGYQIVFRSRNILGTYESRIVLERGDTPINGPHQGGWIETAGSYGKGNDDWFIHFQEVLPYGRILHLQPVKWVNDWPVVGDAPPGSETGRPVLTHHKPIALRTLMSLAFGRQEGLDVTRMVPQTSDEFENKSLGLQWQWFANYQDDWADLAARPGDLRLKAVQLAESTPLYNRPNLLLQKLPAETFTVNTLLDASGLRDGDSAGLVVVGRSTASLTVRKTVAGLAIARTQFQANTAAGSPQPPDTDQASAPLPGPTVHLRVHVAPRAICTFFYSIDGQSFIPLGQPFTAAPDQWIGAKVGLFCNALPPTPNPPVTQPQLPRGHADFDYFHVE